MKRLAKLSFVGNCTTHADAVISSRLTLVLRTAIVILLFFASASLFANERERSPSVVTVYSYHLKPPFIIDEAVNSGLYYDMLSLLSDETVEYQLAYMPRKRINKLLENNDLQGVVIGVSPHWFSDGDKTKYLWSIPFIEDKDEIVSNADTPFEFQVDELSDKAMAGVRGLFYVGLNNAIEDGQLKRFDTESEEQIIDMIEHQRVNFGVVSKSTLAYLYDKNDYIKSIHISKVPHEEYFRHMLVPRHLSRTESHLNQRLQSELNTPEWRTMLRRYGVDFIEIDEGNPEIQ